MAKLMDVPFVAEDSTTFSEAGYRGRDVREALKDVVNAAGGDMERGKHAVVFLGEFDKLCATGSEAREARQYGTQHGFLTLLNGIFDGSGIDPGGFLFVFAGAFPCLGEINSTRTDCNKTLALSALGIRIAPSRQSLALLTYSLAPRLRTL